MRCLELCVDPEQEKLDDRYFDECGLRDMTELLCLLFVLQLLMAYGPERILRAKFVEKWLARQNWGDTVEERQRNFADYMQYKQNRVTEIVARIKETRLGRRTLEKAGLIKRKHRGKHVKKSAAAGAHGSGTSNGGGSGGSSSNDRNVVEEPLQLSMDLLPGGNGNGGGEGDGDENGLPDDEIANNETDADEPLSLLPHQQTNEHVPRVLEQSVEEQRLRRLHREAMVLNDGTRPIGRDSIIESHREDFN